MRCIYAVIFIFLGSQAYSNTTQTVPGDCPPILNPITDCSTAKFSSDCAGEDSDCEEGLKCCPSECGSQNCRKPLMKQRPGCPVEDFLCIKYQQLCNSDQDCQKGQLCCNNPSCGTSCKDAVLEVLIPELEPGSDCPLVKCSGQCPSGFEVDTNGCQTCQCLPGEPKLRCDVGDPLNHVSCGRNQPNCPTGYHCKISLFDEQNGICCKSNDRYMSYHYTTCKLTSFNVDSILIHTIDKHVCPQTFSFRNKVFDENTVHSAYRFRCTFRSHVEERCQTELKNKLY